jgi:hypothetical protein
MNTTMVVLVVALVVAVVGVFMFSKQSWYEYNQSAGGDVGEGSVGEENVPYGALMTRPETLANLIVP